MDSAGHSRADSGRFPKVYSPNSGLEPQWRSLWKAVRRQIGFARAVSDGAAFAYLADVYVLPEFRGRGLGLELENGPYSRVKWLLHTADAHALYEKLGFGPPSERLLERQ